MMQPPIGSERATCQQHGLHYDPRVQAGCVLCRRQSLPAGAMAGPTPQAAPAGRGLVIALVSAIAFLAVVAALYGVGKAVHEAEAQEHEQSGNRVAGEPRVSSDRLVTLWVPTLWHEVAAKDTSSEAKLAVAPPGEDVVIVVINELASDFDEGFGVGQYLEVAKKVYSKPDKKIVFREFGMPEPFEIDGRPAMRISYQATKDGIRLQGHVYCVRGPSHFHQFLTLGVPSAMGKRHAEIESIVTQARLVAGT